MRRQAIVARAKKNSDKLARTRNANKRMNGLVTMCFFFAYCLIELLSGMTRFEHCFLAEALLTTKKLAELQCHV